ncbi:hypothetical protein LIN78_12885 [Leeia sp. TBRC 13508]|uniref:Glycoside hydrolase family 3 N-terminal domain-containing protein n=1 Tax=Leeia speluncae TaxID=2884804 RepID=A0ABS8D8I2_9NEIS|nr:glycoside hydrolase family 3 N-terminal domain-containing protein [Leeia speluncae]MCB6184442.1 hypothetical protein [Leeia speluncae]
MNSNLIDAYAVMLPAFSDLTLSKDVTNFLKQGGMSLLLGETREEYVSRKMTSERIRAEKANDFSFLVSQAKEIAQQPLLVAVDQELGGIQRLHQLVPALPSSEEASLLSDDDLEEKAKQVATTARTLGINMFLSPIVDIVTGENPWLHNRTLGQDAAVVGKMANAFTLGIQAGGVAAVAKHFPGHPTSVIDPAIGEAIVKATKDELQPTLSVFETLIASDVNAIMIGPALVPVFDANEPSSTSQITIRYLRETMGFSGLIISDDLDAPGIHRGRSIAETAIASLIAGADLLLLSSEAGLDEVANAIIQAAENGLLKIDRLQDAANRVRKLATTLASVN